MFPYSKYLHIGGDEATISLWDQCPHCKKYMQENNIDGIYDLYSDYVARISDKVLSYGKIPMVWEGFPKIGAERISKKVVVIAWESHYHLAPDLLSEGFSVINASWQPLYIVPWIEYRWTPYDILDWNVYNWQHWWEKSYAALNPITVPETAKVLGSSLCAWESTYEQSASRIMENLAAMNERAWNTCGNVSKAEYTAVFNAIYKIAAKIMQ
jgi:hexosaminidase